MTTIQPYMYHIKNDLVPEIAHRVVTPRVQDTYTGPVKGLDDPVVRPAGSWKMRKGTIKLTTLAKQYHEFGMLLACAAVPACATLATARSLYQVAGINKLRQKIHEEIAG